MKVITIGRLEDNDVVVNDACASRHHLQIIQHDDGHYSLADFGSTNGTFINGQKISGEVELNMNDVVRIGNSTIPWRLYFEKNEQETTQFNNVSPEFDEVPQHDDASQHKDTDTLTSNPTMPLKKERSSFTKKWIWLSVVIIVIGIIIAMVTYRFLNSKSYKIRGHWSLQEVQIPFDQEYSDGIYIEDVIQISDKSFEVWGDDRMMECFTYKINNDSVLTLNNGCSYKNYIIKEVTKDELVLADPNTCYGYMILKYVHYAESPVRYEKHNFLANDDRNPIVQRLSNSELTLSNTPASVAYNFVSAICHSNSDKMFSYMTPEFISEFESQMISDNYSNYDSFFSEPESKLNIKGWKPYIDSGKYEIAVLYVQDEGFDELGRVCKKVYVDCVLSSEVDVKGFQDITREGNTNVKVLVVDDNGIWKVIGFK